MPETTAPVTGTILHLQRLSTEDGPGIRTTVFYKGCPLKCAWCHNPESLLLKPQVQWIGNRCISCDSCLETCDRHSLEKTANGIKRDRTRCITCGKCVQACPTGAMEMLGEDITVIDLANELVKDRAFFEKSNGGVTLSGGEPSLQPAFTLALIKALKDRGLSIALDTSGLCPPDTLEKLIDNVDIILFDLKLINELEHEQWTGVSNKHILANLLIAKERVQSSQNNKKLWVRTPLIPQATDHRENIEGIGEYLAQHMRGSVERWELCAFNNLCRDKYARLEKEWVFAETPLMSAGDLARIEMWAKDSGFDPERIFVTGAIRIDN
ncbi:MAG: pyruvate formate lyase activating enzyme [Chloroflexi bacterium]|nr:MAG: pyruvate formate lyase activating enzyme [Chloroflexota bacterium]